MDEKKTGARLWARLLALAVAAAAVAIAPGSPAAAATVTASASPNQIAVGQAVPVRGTGAPPKGAVAVQRRVNATTWSTRATGTADSAGRFSIPIRPSQVGIYALRVRTGNRYSPIFYVRVLATPGITYATAAGKVGAAGWTPLRSGGFSPGSGLAFITAYPSPCGAGCPQRHFFFGAGKLLGTDSAGSGSTSAQVSGPTSVSVIYYLYGPNDPSCCPSAGTARVVFANVTGTLKIVSGRVPSAYGYPHR